MWARSQRLNVRRALLVVGVAMVVAGLGPRAALASSWWHVTTSTRPANLVPGGEGTIVVHAINAGNSDATAPVSISDVLPEGLTVSEVEVEGKAVQQVGFFASALGPQLNMGLEGFLNSIFPLCHVTEGTVSTVSCEEPAAESFASEVLAPLPDVRPFESLEMQIKVKVASTVTSAVNSASVSGASFAPVTSREALTISSAPTTFGADQLSVVPEKQGGEVDVQAGSHPYQLTSTFGLNQTADTARPPALPRDLEFKLPPGLIGNTTIIPQCSDADFTHLLNGGSANACSEDSAVGVAVITIDEPVTLELRTIPVPIFNLAPGAGEPARFGFEYAGSPVILDTAVRAGSDYGVTVKVNNITESVAVVETAVTFWGAPGDPSHDQSRGWGCVAGGKFAPGISCIPSTQTQPPPFLTLPTACGEAFTTTVEGRSWPTQQSAAGVQLGERAYSLNDDSGQPLTMSGCEAVPFAPKITVTPDSHEASSSSGLLIRVQMPQESAGNANGLANASIKNTTLTLPQGLVVNPSAASGLEACSEGAVGFIAIETDETQRFTPTLATSFCPDAAKIGTVSVKVPVITNPLKGSVYLAAQTANPFHSLLAVYVVAEDPVSGIILKLAGDVKLSESGQMTTELNHAPQAPIDEAEFSLFGGNHGVVATPAACGDYESVAAVTPWSNSTPTDVASHFTITGGRGPGCPTSVGFAPSIVAGAQSTQRGAFTSFDTTILREDGEPNLRGVSLRMPAGVSALIATVTPCAEAQADAGTCEASSLIGHTNVSVGVGETPYQAEQGLVYLTGPYRGAPFGLSIVNPAKAGPFDLGKVVVRAKLDVDRRTAQAIATLDSTGPYAIPELIKGIPLSLRRVDVAIDRPGFVFNPTGCERRQVLGALESVGGATAPFALPFTATNCATLGFAPKIAFSSDSRTSKLNGANLNVRLSYPPKAMGSQANVASVKVTLPKQLPSRLTTLQKACLAHTFETNPANCPPQSIVGHATIKTPVLPVALSGPAYFVSHGGEAFPSLVMVLQGDNVVVELVGATLIRNGVTSSTFKSTPDVPFESFALSLPRGKFSALTAFGNLCKTAPHLGVEFTAQNGAKLAVDKVLSVEHCKAKRKIRRKIGSPRRVSRRK